MGRIEKRSFLWNDFVSELEAYYAVRNCEVVFQMEDDGSCIAEFTVHPRGKKYFLDKKAFDPESEDPQAEALAELKRIFFPFESVAIREVLRRPGDPDSDVVLLVETDVKAPPSADE